MPIVDLLRDVGVRLKKCLKLEMERVSLISRMVEVGRFSRNSVDHVLD